MRDAFYGIFVSSRRRVAVLAVTHGGPAVARMTQVRRVVARVEIPMGTHNEFQSPKTLNALNLINICLYLG